MATVIRLLFLYCVLEQQANSCSGITTSRQQDNEDAVTVAFNLKDSGSQLGPDFLRPRKPRAKRLSSDTFEPRIIPHQGSKKQYRIIGGATVEGDRYPYLVTLINKISDTVMYQVCGGILVAPQWVLSAAHCVGKVNTAQVGRSDLRDTHLKFESFGIKQTVQHDFERSSYDYDFVLFKLDAPSQFPWAKLNYDPNIPQVNDVLTVIGWGVTDNGESSAVANEAGVSYIENSICETMYKNEMITHRMLCASSPGKDACQGDSGGPLLLKGPDSDLDLLVGVVSWGYGCADPDHPGVYARVSEEADWVEDIVCDSSPSSCYQMMPPTSVGGAEEMSKWDNTVFNYEGSSSNATMLEIKPPAHEDSPPLEESESEKNIIFQSFKRFDQITKIVVICCFFLVSITATAALATQKSCSFRNRKCLRKRSSL